MKTKERHTSEFSSNEAMPIIRLFFDFAQLKNLYRQGWLECKIPEGKCETVAEHSFSVALLGHIVSKEHFPDLDSDKILKLGLFHDVGEIYAGDVMPRDNIGSEEKSQNEYESVKKIFSRLKNSEEYIELWLEYEKQGSPEAKFVKQMDKLEMALQANLYEKMDDLDLGEFFDYAEDKIHFSELKKIFKEVLESRERLKSEAQ